MTKAEAANILSNDIIDGHVEGNARFMDAFWFAVDNLKAEPCEDAVKREAVLNTLDTMDKALDEDRTVEAYKELLKECYKALSPVTPKPTECEDAVSREAALKAIEGKEYQFQVYEAIEKLPPVTPKQRWIPVSERLPKIEEYCDVSDWVLATVEDRCNPEHNLYRHVIYAYWDGAKWCDEYENDYFNDAEDDIKVTAWMPQIEPYKEGEGE